MKNSIVLLVTVGVVSACFLFKINKIEAKHKAQIKLQNDSIFNLKVEVVNHKNLVNDIVNLVDANCFEQINRINLHFGKNVQTTKTK